DHALGHLAVGLARADLEPARQHAPRKDDHDAVAGREVGGAAHDVLRLTGAVGVADVDLAVADRLLEARQLLDRQDLADHERPLDVGAGPLDRLDLQARRDQLLGQLPAVDAGRELGVLAHPRKRSPHQISIPNGRVNRTSPYTMSYMSS